MIANYSDDHLEGLEKLAGSYHDISTEKNGSKIFLQLGHAGRQVSPSGFKGEIISSSPIEERIHKKIPKALDSEEIKEIAVKFAEAAKRAKKAGFDGIQFHGAHGYLITQFYSPFMNKRTDEYGGNTENRARFVLELLKECRKRVGNNFPITMKMNGSDRIEGGLDVNEAVGLARIFSNAGFDALEISSYIWEAGIQEKIISLPPESQRKLRERGIEAYNLEYARKIKNKLLKTNNIPIIVVGGLYRFETISNIINNTPIEFCSLCRPLISQPNLVSIWKEGPPFPESECIHCNACTQAFLVRGPKFKGLRCVWKERVKKRK
jgi:2,4-dienoyl-CoA reductase-like NADH-dependent reductase (Old Yellow Enzyme family)